jgi:hypothetical protein
MNSRMDVWDSSRIPKTVVRQASPIVKPVEARLTLSCRCIYVIFFEPKGHFVMNKYCCRCCCDAVADAVAAWQAITSLVRSNKSQLQNLVHYHLPYRKKDQFKAYEVKKDIPRMEMVHHQDVAVELSTRLLTAQHEIETLRAQL